MEDNREVINDQDIVVGLFMLGFEQVDCMFAVLVTSKLALDKQMMKKYKLGSGKPTDTFNKYVKYDRGFYRFRDGYSINSIVDSLSMSRLLNANIGLVEYFNELDFSDIINRKIKTLGLNTIPNNSTLFSDKEKSIYEESKEKKLFMEN